MNNYDFTENIKAKIIAEEGDFHNIKQCKEILSKCVMGKTLVKEYLKLIENND